VTNVIKYWNEWTKFWGNKINSLFLLYTSWRPSELYIQIYSVLHRNHTRCLLQTPIAYWCTRKQYLFVAVIILKGGKMIPLQAGVAQRVGRGIALPFHDRGTRRGWVVSSTPRPHFTSGKDTVPILHEAGWAPGPVWTGGKSRPHRDSIPERTARSQSLYQLSYPAHAVIILKHKCRI